MAAATILDVWIFPFVDLDDLQGRVILIFWKFHYIQDRGYRHLGFREMLNVTH